MTENVQILGGISEVHKKHVRKLLRTEHVGKSFDSDAYLSLIKSVSEKQNICENGLREFVDLYTREEDGKIVIFGKKMVRAKKGKAAEVVPVIPEVVVPVAVEVPLVIQEPVPEASGPKMIKRTRIVRRLVPKVRKPEVPANEYNQPLPDGVHIVQFKPPVYQPQPVQQVHVTPAVVTTPMTKYVYPKETIAARIHREAKYGPHGTQWVNDIQLNDVMTPDVIKKQIHHQKLLEIKVPEQRSEGWFKMRKERITASDGGCVLGMNEHEPKYKFILKKTVGDTFKGNLYCYHGKKYEKAAIMIYEYRFNVSLNEFGLIGHPSIRFLGASPDGIVGLFKNDGTHYTRNVGRMLEIKCPFTRKIKMEGHIDDIVPIYYQVQVQLQLECCDLDECDFWQCKISEYASRTEFVNDTDPLEPFRSKQTQFEKGCLIQLIPKATMKVIIETKKYWDNVYDEAIFLYPAKIEMTPCECDIWVSQTVGGLYVTHPDYVFDKVIYWKLEHSHCLLIERDKKWFAEKLPELERMWNYVEFFRANKTKLDLLIKYLDSLSRKMNDKIMKVVETLAKVPKANTPEEYIYKEFLNKLEEEIESNLVHKAELKSQKDDRLASERTDGEKGNGTYMF
ncbi:MAG: YqaJ-like viral recombinase domain [Harvfovirus sp.]|uniref:YqaJ-like viral recombinase domain n=1 Tax=Harvfovirus sp. TaxID=2487768 RepID=A0A3G5A616_9VIRU|nr:MAG: YqaJ-like viral recombinase domain [Harvfovirus sp.]